MEKSVNVQHSPFCKITARVSRTKKKNGMKTCPPSCQDFLPFFIA